MWKLISNVDLHVEISNFTIVRGPPQILIFPFLKKFMLSYYEIYEDFWFYSPNKPIHEALGTNISKRRRLDSCSNNVVYVFS
jgi:hypothetical protein